MPADESLLFLWTVNSKTEFAFKILRKWGFKFQVVITWYKHTGPHLAGLYRSTENCLMAYRGKLDVSTKHPIRTFVDEAAAKHSQKPKKFYAMVLRATKSPRIDIFARKRHNGFTSWGDQVEDSPDILDRFC